MFHSKLGSHFQGVFGNPLMEPANTVDSTGDHGTTSVVADVHFPDVRPGGSCTQPAGSGRMLGEGTAHSGPTSGRGCSGLRWRSPSSHAKILWLSCGYRVVLLTGVGTLRTRPLASESTRGTPLSGRKGKFKTGTATQKKVI